jgi:hypothetical protein
MNLLKSHTWSQKLLLFQEIRLVFISFAGNQVVFHSFSPCKLHNAATKSPHSVRWVPRAPRGLWQITLGALNSGAGRMLATILSQTKWEFFNHLYMGNDFIPTMVSNISSTSVKLSF